MGNEVNANINFAKLNGIMVDGKVTAGEVSSLNDAEKAELQKMLKGKELPKDGEILYFREPDATKTQKNNGGNLKLKPVSTAKNVAGASVGGLAIAGLAFLCGASAPLSIGLGILALCTSSFSLCSEEDPDTPATIVEGNKTEINNNVSVEVKQDITAMVNAINALKDADEAQHAELMAEIKSLLASLADQKQALNTIIELLKAQGLTLEVIVTTLNDAGKSVTEIVNALKVMGTDIKEIAKTLVGMGLKLDEVVAQLVSLGKTTKEILEALKASGAQLGDIAIQLKDNTEILKEISGKNTKIYNAIVDLMNQGDKISGEYKAILNDILNKIGSQNASDLSKVEDMLATIINKLNQQITNQEEMSKVDKAFYDAVLAKLDGMTAEQKAFFNAVLAKLCDMDDAEKEAFEKLLAAIEKNTAVSEKTFEIANKILEAMDKDANGDYSDILNKILEKLGTINGGGVSSTDLTKVESLLEAILAKIDKSIDNQDKMAADNLEFYNTLLAKLDGMKGDQAEAFESLLAAIKENTEVAKGTFEVANKILAALGKLGDKADEAINVLKNLSTGGDCNFKPEDMKAFIEAVVKGLKDTYTAGNEKLLAKLDEILNKIPEGCKCDHSELLAKLEIIITKMEKPDSDDNSHEGIVGDLEDIFG